MHSSKLSNIPKKIKASPHTLRTYTCCGWFKWMDWTSNTQHSVWETAAHTAYHTCTKNIYVFMRVFPPWCSHTCWVIYPSQQQAALWVTSKVPGRLSKREQIEQPQPRLGWIQMSTLWSCRLRPRGLQLSVRWCVHCHAPKSLHIWIQPGYWAWY